MQDSQIAADVSSQSGQSKKDTEASSSQEQKSEFSKITLFECSDSEQKNFKMEKGQSLGNFEIFDQEKSIQMG